jgi:cold shock CspA family protein
MTERAPRKTWEGTIIWFDQKADCGFVKPDDGSADVFVRASIRMKFQVFEMGDRVEYELLWREAFISGKL